MLERIAMSFQNATQHCSQPVKGNVIVQKEYRAEKLVTSNHGMSLGYHLLQLRWVVLLFHYFLLHEVKDLTPHPPPPNVQSREGTLSATLLEKEFVLI